MWRVMLKSEFAGQRCWKALNFKKNWIIDVNLECMPEISEASLSHGNTKKILKLLENFIFYIPATLPSLLTRRISRGLHWLLWQTIFRLLHGDAWIYKLPETCMGCPTIPRRAWVSSAISNCPTSWMGFWLANYPAACMGWWPRKIHNISGKWFKFYNSY